MKNLISNTCVGARLYYVTHSEFNNPFCWAGLDVDDFIVLCTSYNEINVMNIDIALEYCHRPWQGDKANPYVNLDNKLNVHFRHYLQNDTLDNDIITTVNIESNDIISYCRKKWYDRYKRGKNISPTFLYTLNYQRHSDYASRMEYINKFKKLINCVPQHKLYILCHRSMHDVCMKNIDETKINKLITIIWMPDDEFVVGNDIQLGKNINKYIDLLN